ncbi:MAG: WD40/YVTN/BNR-like repeat-containing protein, partial [bacterium]
MVSKLENWALKCFAVLFFLVSHLFAQGWQWQNPLPQGNRLGEVQFVDSLHGWIRAEWNTILRTTDGGLNWREEIIAQNNDSVYFQRIYFIDPLNGWAVGAGAPPVIMRTRDGGKNWESMPLPAERNNGNYYSFCGLHFLDAWNGCITDGFGSIFHTMDGGYSWVRQRVPALPPYPIRSIWFVSSRKGWAVGERKFLSTTDGGRTWVQHDSLASPENTRVVFQDSLSGWVLSKFHVFRTANGGSTWKVHAIDSNASAWGSDPVWGDFYSKEILFLDPGQAWIATSWGLYSSTDSGKTWARINQENGYEGVWFTDKKHGWTTGGKAYAANYEINNQIFETIDGGMSYQSKRMMITNKTLSGVDFIDDMTGWAVGADGTILHSIDGGKTWRHQTSPSTSWLRQVVFLDKNQGWIVGFNGTIMHTNDGGQSWRRQNSGTAFQLEEASFLNTKEGWVVGWELSQSNTPMGIVLHTLNGG